jgi:hypothetical protein
MINKVVSIVILDEGDGEMERWGDHKLLIYGRGARLAPRNLMMRE